ncbi:GNAT family N-acetyltransferase [Corynebacterium bovis]|uniref:N-acetyltransferase n=1 Tax=Corynebacterium bovis TaxID=36808 RepID=A0A426PX74_9CORY|nr:GNAT family N-acetyltransferase [Corynebacterium bovis]MDN8578556.1 GNAT family N-acetyltransferase [Corynebacterium bovis]RRO85798.1 N-acetyltransferase [Corynebacterium bovis]RRO89593.1 N-acetyltransferase [Corynebacterium bovis]
MSQGLTDKTGAALTVTLDEDAASYVVTVDDTGEQAGAADFIDDTSDPENPARIFHHTVVDDRFGGRGIGSALVEGALDDTRERGVAVVPVCSMVAHWLTKHGEDFTAAGGTVREPGEHERQIVARAAH